MTDSRTAIPLPVTLDHQQRGPSEVTRLLHAHRSGESGALESLLPLVYRDLKAIARRHRARSRPGETLSTTALVHEAYFKLSRDAAWNDRQHFFAVASRAMRHLLVDYARTKATLKRGDNAQVLPLDEARVGVERQAEDMLAIEQALEQLGELSPRLSDVFECRYFGGLGEKETAESLGLTLRTVQRDWMKAKAFLRRQLA